MEKLFEFLKAGAGASLALAIASGALLLGMSKGVIPLQQPPITFAVWALLFFGSAMTITGGLKAVSDFLKPGAWLVHRRNQHAQTKEAERYLDHMSEVDREIVAYLLHHNRKMFTGAADGGYARELIARGLINRAVRPGNAFYQDDVPFSVNEQAWAVLVKNRDRFPFDGDENTPHPWRIPWQLQ